VSTPEATFHTYAVNWTQATTTWLIDGTPVRTLNFADAVGGQNYPQTPMNIRLGNWVAGDPKNAPGTIQWAGGLTDFSQGPFNMYVQSVKVINYNPAVSYQYGDMTGMWQSITMDNVAATASVEGSSSNSTTGPGEVESASSESSSSGTSAAAPAGSVVSINLGGQGNGAAASFEATGMAPSTPCSTVTGTGATVTIAAASGNANAGAPSGNANAGTPSVVSINLGSNGTLPTGASSPNSAGSSGGGIVAAGAGSNATLPTVTVNLGSPNGGNGAAATGMTTAVTAGANNPAQTSFSLGAQTNGTATSSGGPLQATTNSGSRVQAGGLLAAVGIGMFFL
jgi:hypothetical protein